LLEQFPAGVQQFVRATLALGEAGPGAVDVRPRTLVGAVEKQDAGPEVNRILEPTREVPIQTGVDERVDLSSAPGLVVCVREAL
jgi:hypothetical protein